MSKLAKEIGMSRPGLGWICLKHTSPNEETSKKLAAVLGLEEREVARLVHWNKLENLENLELIEKAVAGKCMDRVFEALRDSDDMLYQESPRLSDFQLYRQLLKRERVACSCPIAAVASQSFQLIRGQLHQWLRAPNATIEGLICTLNLKQNRQYDSMSTNEDTIPFPCNVAAIARLEEEQSLLKAPALSV